MKIEFEWQPNVAAKTGVANGSSPKGLTSRELEVLRYIAEGHSTKQVSAMLGIAFKTAACHRYQMMAKLGIHDTATLVRYAIRSGLVQL